MATELAMQIAAEMLPGIFTTKADIERVALRIDVAIAPVLAENERLRQRLLTAAGDDLCRLSQEEITAYTSGEVPIPPKEEFIPSCERFWEQIAATAGVNHSCLTLAQLVAEIERLQSENERLKKDVQRYYDQWQHRPFQAAD